VLAIGVFAYLLDGAGLIMYSSRSSRAHITIVGTLSPPIPRSHPVWRIGFLARRSRRSSRRSGPRHRGCVGLAYQPADAAKRRPGAPGSRWHSPALVLWAVLRRSSSTTTAWRHRRQHGLYSMFGRVLTLALRFVEGRAGTHSIIEWTRSFLPMGMMAAGRPWRAHRKPVRQDLDRGRR